MGPGADADLAFLTTAVTSLSKGKEQLKSVVGGGDRGTYPGDPKGTFFAGSLYWSLMYCSTSSLVASNFPLFFPAKSCRAYLKGFLLKLALSFSFLFLCLRIRSALHTQANLTLTAFLSTFRPSLSSSEALLHLLRSWSFCCTRASISASLLPFLRGELCCTPNLTLHS